ncbi:MAG: iron-sulfur cluster-binding protein [Bacteroidetes bacterium]|nr:MAG: iron-sulfur cluster-binding protein [Bacteroidota bacterium]
MGNAYQKFIKDTENKAFDLEHRNKINYNISKYDTAVERGKKQYANLDLARKRAQKIKHKVVNNLEKYLIEFAANFEENGGKIIWAQDDKEAVSEILSLMEKHEVKNVVKSKSMTTEEIEINEALEKKGIESLETDLGEYIVQIAGEKPYHIVTPAMHKSKEDIADLFHDKFNTPRESTPTELTHFVRDKLRKKFITADLGITGGNFLIADTGSVCLTENEGNGLLSFSFPKVHIAVVGIEKIIPSLTDLDLFWPLLATHGTGQNMTVYNSIISGPRQDGEVDGPAEMYLVLLENNRSKILNSGHQRMALSCIRCGACLNACPVYKNIGGHSYSTTYSGPIGAVITPFLKGMEEYKHLSFASSLCGKCTDVCPVNIPLHELLLYNRNDSVKEGYTATMDKLSMFGMNKAFSNRKMIDLMGARSKNIALRLFFKKLWGPRRDLPKIAKKSFRDMWLEERGKN